MDFDEKEFARLLALAKGSQRSINRYGKESTVDPGYISRFLRQKMKYPPSPQVILRLAKHAYNGVTAEELMSIAGYWSEDFLKNKSDRIPKVELWEFEDLFNHFKVTFKGIGISKEEEKELLRWLRFIRLEEN